MGTFILTKADRDREAERLLSRINVLSEGFSDSFLDRAPMEVILKKMVEESDRRAEYESLVGYKLKT